MYEDDIKNLKNIISELTHKVNCNNQKDKEINNLRIMLCDLKKEYSALNNNYESVLSDLQNNINTNEKLRQLIIDLENKIENHNNNVSGMDLAIRQQIENLTRNSLARKNIEHKTNKEVINKVKDDHIALNHKIDNYNMQKLSFSQVLPKFNELNSSVHEKCNNSVCVETHSIKNGNYVEITGVEKLPDDKILKANYFVKSENNNNDSGRKNSEKSK